jgi:hypothetical protein
MNACPRIRENPGAVGTEVEKILTSTLRLVNGVIPIVKNFVREKFD